MGPPLLGDARFRLGAVIVGIIPAFALTLIIVGRYKDQRTQLAGEWASRGEHDVTRKPAAAVVDYQTALAYGADDSMVRLRLAEALIASGSSTEARAHLLTLWAQEPGDGRLNLDLARLAAADGDLSEATRYYHAAIDGAWDTDATVARRKARLELATLLLRSQQPVRALAELIALIDDLPPDAALITNVGSLLVQAGSDARALGLFERALMIDPTNALAARLEGEVQFRAGRYDAAHDLLAAAKQNGATLDAADEMMLESSARVPMLDPLANRLSMRQRLQRTLDALAIARTRIARCQAASLPPADAAHVADLSRQADEFDKVPRGRLERNPDQVTDINTLIVQIEALPEQACGPDTPDDRALQLIAAAHRLQAG